MKLLKWQEGLNKCIDHIIQLKKDGDLLLRRGSYAHAYFLYFTALEEIATANFILARIDNPDTTNLKKIIYKHDKKVPLAVSSIYIPEIQDLSDLIDILKENKRRKISFGSQKDLNSKDFKLGEKIEKRKNLWYWRKRAIYTTMNESCTDFLSPEDLKIEQIRDLPEKIELQLAEIQALRNLFYKFKNNASIIKEMKKRDELNKNISNIINLTELLKLLLNGSLEEISHFKNIDPEIRDLYISIFTNKEMDDSILSNSLEKIQKLIQNIMKTEEPKSEIEKQISKFYTEQVLHYKPDYYKKSEEELQNFINELLKRFIDRIINEGVLEPSERDIVLSFSNLVLPMFINMTDENKELINTYKDKLEEIPDDKESLENLGILYLNVGNYQEGYNYFLNLHRLDKKNDKYLYILGEIDFEINHNYKKAKYYYNEILKEDLYYEGMYHKLGIIYESSKKYKKAIKYYWSEISDNLDSEDAWFRIANIYIKKKKKEQAIFYLKMTLKINPLHKEANILLNELVDEINK